MPVDLDAEWTVTELIAWLAALGVGPGLAVDAPVYPGPYRPDMDDRLFVATPVSGPGETMEGLGDIGGFQLFTRGDQGDPASGELLAKRADRRIRFGPMPYLVPGTGLVLGRVLRSGGPPTGLPEDDGDRVPFVCTYLTEILRTP